LRKSLLMYMKDKHGACWWEWNNSSPQADLKVDIEAGAECIWRAMEATWWEWTGGSRLLFWRWPPEHREAARDGYQPYVVSPLPHYKRPQPNERDSEVKRKVALKLHGVRGRKYIDKGEVKSLTSYFCVPKGESDIRMVYDASRSGLNHSLWAPNFGLPAVDALVRGVMDHSWMGDLDIGEMFLNFCMHPELRPFCGVDLKPYFSDECEKGQTLWERWVRCMMGLKSSPYVCIKGLLIAIEMVKGDRWDRNNVFGWATVKITLILSLISATRRLSGSRYLLLV
jgi:hypothetical protein